jgi:hypothetical protein
MKESIDTKYCRDVKKRVIVFNGLLVLLLVLDSPVVTAYEDSDPQLAPENSGFDKSQEKDISFKPDPSLDGLKASLSIPLIDLSDIQLAPKNSEFDKSQEKDISFKPNPSLDGVTALAMPSPFEIYQIMREQIDTFLIFVNFLLNRKTRRVST